MNVTELKTEKLNPLADPAAMVIEDKVRFTILTSRLIRLEWMEDGIFQDYASFVVLNRRLPVPQFDVEEKDGWLEISTEHLHLRYKKGSGMFTSSNLQIDFELNGVKKYWHPGMDDVANLRGTTRTLDRIKGAINLEPGIISKDGWTLVNDSEGPLFNDDADWQWVMGRPEKNQQDWYFFGYGHDFREALHAFTQISGKIPLPPRYTFGYWWSRYWPYTDEDFQQLVNEFDMHDVPLDVMVIDMDWHLNFKDEWLKNQLDQAGEKKGWTGFTWNKNFFPEPEKFIRWLKRKGVKVTMNLHPASGVQPHEEQYPAMARAMGIDPATEKYVPFDITDKKFAKNYFEILLHPYEKWGVDFWWLDWQQWSTTKIKGVTPTFWLNYVHFSDMEKQGKRPLLFHRWGGLGNHRYQVGFSGDTYIDWKSLSFQPYFTATAANVGFGYWSHDIGGHYKGISTPEMYTRWIQFGVFSPIFRTHCSNNPRIERRIWAFPSDYFFIMRDAILLRYALIPYIYTMARQAYDTGVSIVYPTYYDAPDTEEAYIYRNQYMFGSQMLVAPIVKHIEEENLAVWQTIWIPEGEWIEWYSGTVLKGPAVYTRDYTIEEIPLFVKAGSVIPMQPKMKRSNEFPLDNLILSIFPGKSGSIRVYEDEEGTDEYKQGVCSFTPIDFTNDNGTYKIYIHSIDGEFPGMLKERSYEIRLVNTFLANEVVINGISLPLIKASYSDLETEACYYYDGSEMATIIKIPVTSVYQPIEIIAKFDTSQPTHLLNGAKGRVSWFKKVRKEMNARYNEYQEWIPDLLIDACQTSHRISVNPENAVQELQDLNTKFLRILDRVEEMTDDNPIFEPSLKLLQDMEKQFFHFDK